MFKLTIIFILPKNIHQILKKIQIHFCSLSSCSVNHSLAFQHFLCENNFNAFWVSWEQCNRNRSKLNYEKVTKLFCPLEVELVQRLCSEKKSTEYYVLADIIFYVLRPFRMHLLPFFQITTCLT